MATRALLVSGNPELSSLRAAVLGSAGVETTLSMGIEEATRRIAESVWDALVICHTAGKCQSMVDAFRARFPQGKVVVILNSQTSEPSARADEFVLGIDGPAALIQAVLTPR